MKYGRWLALSAVLLAASSVRPAPVTPEQPRQLGLPGFATDITLVPCKAAERTVVIVTPATDKARERHGLVGLYAYDAAGNCIARDEYTERGLAGARQRSASDDAAVEWFATTAATYTVELRNQSLEPNLFVLAIR